MAIYYSAVMMSYVGETAKPKCSERTVIKLDGRLAQIHGLKVCGQNKLRKERADGSLHSLPYVSDEAELFPILEARCCNINNFTDGPGRNQHVVVSFHSLNTTLLTP